MFTLLQQRSFQMQMKFKCCGYCPQLFVRNKDSGVGVDSPEAPKTDKNGLLFRMGKNQYVSMETIEKICKKLDCTVDEMMEFTDDE